MTKKKGKRHTPEQIVKKLRDAETMLNSGKGSGSGISVAGDQRTDLLPLAKSVWRYEVNRSETLERT